MKKKILFLLLIVFLTILLIGFVKIFIKKDLTKTQHGRLDFFSENLTLQKNNILSSYQKSASLMYSEILRDSLLIKLIDSPQKSDSADFFRKTNALNKRTLPYFNSLKKIGFSSLLFILKQNGSYYIFNSGNGECKPAPPEYIQILPDKFEKTPYSGSNIYKKQIDYSYYFPLFSKTHESEISYIEMGVDFHIMNELLAANLSNNEIGFIIYTLKDEMANSIKPINEFKNSGFDENVFVNNSFEQSIGYKFHEKDRKELVTKIKNASEKNISGNFSIYLNSFKNPEAISFSDMNYLGNGGKIFVVSSTTDLMLNKTKEWNNQIFIINLIIIILAMIGIVYLYLNRVNLLKEKINIEHSESKLKELNQSKDKFFSILAHDLKNPFNGIMGMSGYLVESYSEIDDAERKEIISDINISSKNAFNLLQNLLEWTRTQSGQIKNVPIKIDPKNIIELSLETVLNLAKNKEIEIVQIFQTDKKGYADENLVSTVLRNLFTNAVKFSSRKSKVEVIVKQFENDLVFCVKDSGIGLRSDEIDQLFRIDVNFHKKGTEEETGTGLGLKICKEFVEYCHGRIWVISEPMEGSSFFFTIPIYQ